MAYRLVAMDVDGTLVGPGPDTVRPRVVDALRAAHRQGVILVLATGRGPRMVRHIIEQVGVPFGLVLANGALLADGLDRPPIEHRLLPLAVATEAIARYRAAGFEPIVFDDPLRGEAVLYEREHPTLADWLPRNSFRARRVDDLQADLPGRPLMIGIFGGERAIRVLGDELATVFAGRASVQPLFHPKYDCWTLDVFAPGCCKGQGTARYAAHRDVAPAEVLAIGDGLNDLPLLRAVGRGVAMGGSPPELLAAADAVVGEFDADGVAEALEQWVLEPIRSVP